MAPPHELNIQSIATPAMVINVLPDDSLVVCAANSAAQELFPATTHE